MPEWSEVAQGLANIAGGTIWLAVVWHVVIGAALISLWRGWLPSTLQAATMLVLPLLSVSVMAFRHDNPFNGFAFGLLAAGLAFAGMSVSPSIVARGPGWSSAFGAAMIGYGWLYPHFLADRSPLLYLVAAPVGLIPCPTLAVVIGFMLLGGGLGSRGGSLLLAAAGGFYGVLGVAALGVPLDLGLVAGAVALAVLVTPHAWRERLTGA